MSISINNVITWFELPVSDIERAKAFYAEVLQTAFIDEEMDGCRMAIFERNDNALSGMLIKSEDYTPSATGAVVYFNGGDDLAIPLARAVENGAEVMIPKMAIEDGAKGYFAQFKDSEGNRVGLYSLPVRELMEDPLLGEQKKEGLAFLRVCKFKMIEQLTLEGTVTLELIAMGSHENFYHYVKKSF